MLDSQLLVCQLSTNGGNAVGIGCADQFCDVTRFGKTKTIKGLCDFIAHRFAQVGECWITHGLGSKVN